MEFSSTTATLHPVRYPDGSPELLERNLARVARAVPEAGVVVVDNYSTEETRLRTRDLCAEHGWTLVEPEGNTGFGGSSKSYGDDIRAPTASYLRASGQ